MKVRPIYLFLIKPVSKGMPDSSEKPFAADNEESGTPIIISQSTGHSRAKALPTSFLDR